LPTHGDAAIAVTSGVQESERLEQRASQLDPQWRMLRTTAALLLGCSFCLFLPTLFHNLFADDDIYLAFTNRMVRHLPWTDLYLFLLKPANAWEFLPLRDFGYWLDFRLFGDDPFGFHFSNLAWYGLSAAAFWWLIKELILLFRPAWTGQASVLALCGSVLFVVHPAHVEAAAWVASRKDLMAGAIGFLAAATLARGLRTGWPYRYGLSAAVLLLLACFSKAAGMAQVLFLTTLIVAAWRQDPEVATERKIATLMLLWVVVVFAAIVHMKVAETTGIRIENHPGGMAVFDRASRIFSMLGGLLLLPHPMGLYHDVYRMGEWHWLTSMAGVLLTLLALAVLCVRRVLWPLGVVLAVVPWAVYLQLIPFTTWSMASERFLFVSVGGLAIVLVDVMGCLAQPRRIIALLLMISVPMALITWKRVGEWELGTTLRALEYERQPEFHNAIRDQILPVLLSKQRYLEAETLARRVHRGYGAAALLALVHAESAFTEWDKSRAAGPPTPASGLTYCLAMTSVRHALSVGYAQILGEPDVSYNNLLRSIERQTKIRFGYAPGICGAIPAT
jgi:hypothetical protein